MRSRKGATPLTPEEFWDRAIPIPECGCLIWEGYCNEYGYGRASYRGVGPKLTHRIAWEIVNGKIPTGLCVLHQCDTPPCINPNHLFLGTPKENVHDSMRKKRFHCKERKGNAKLSWAKALAIRKSEEHRDIIVQRYSISIATFYSIKNQTTWQEYKPFRKRPEAP